MGACSDADVVPALGAPLRLAARLAALEPPVARRARLRVAAAAAATQSGAALPVAAAHALAGTCSCCVLEFALALETIRPAIGVDW